MINRLKNLFDYRKRWKQQKNRNKKLVKKINKMETSLAEDLRLDITNDEIRKLKQQVNALKNQVKNLNLEAQIQELNDNTIWWTNRFNAAEREIKQLQQENKQLKDNWNKLREYVIKEVIATDNEIYGTDLLDKMQELEKGE